MKRVTGSLFNFLDSKCESEVSFLQFLVKLYPSLTQENLDLINKWIKAYSKTFKNESIDLSTEDKEDPTKKRKRVLPASTMVRINEIFKNMDEGNKGCNIFNYIFKICHWRI